jgi:N-acetylneuraminate synthase/N,N'-diacetyllegionaminate synthase
VTRVALGPREIGSGARVVVIAEAGVNHDGDVDRALALVDAAADAGADIVKFQTFRADRLATTSAPKATYQLATTDEQESQHSMLRRLELPTSAYPALQQRAAARGLLFLSTPFDEESGDLLAGLGVVGFKVASPDLVNHILLLHLARWKRPLLLSTGAATVDEVAAACALLAGRAPVVLLHCVTQYPADGDDANLRAIATMRARFGVPVGWSDHTLGIDVAVAAVAAGADVVEKHLTLDRALPGPDHRASIEPAEFAEMVRRIRDVERWLGDGVKAPRPAEVAVARVARRSVAARVDLAAGARLDVDVLTALRPAGGLRPDRLDDVVGRRLRRAVVAGALIEDADLE